VSSFQCQVSSVSVGVCVSVPWEWTAGYRHAARTCSMDLQQGHAAWTCSKDMQYGCAARSCSRDMQHEHGRGHAAWT
jgi:hypothetical protein